MSDFLDQTLRALGCAPLGVYHAAVAARNSLFRLGLLRTVRLPAPVISVGNLAFGGTGKTPMVVRVVRRLRDLGRRPAVLSRGYGRRRPGGVDDENELLRDSLPGVPVLAGADRAANARRALDASQADCFVLDDGFQHRRLARELDIVMLDAAREEKGFVWRREPLRALGRCHVIVLSGADRTRDAASLAGRLAARFPGKPVCTARRAPIGLTDVYTGARLPLAAAAGLRIGAFCGLASPEGFRRTVEEVSGAPPALFRAWPDHWAYTDADVRRVDAQARAAALDLLLTTAKDAVKLRALPARIEACPVRAVEIEIEILSGEEAFESALAAALTAGPAGLHP